MLSAMALSCGIAQAQNINVDAAEALARQFFASHTTSGPNRAPAKVAPILSYTATTEGTPDFYVFNRAADVPGFVIVNADADATPILGYSETSAFDYDSAPDNFRWWLEQYQQNGVAKAPAHAPADRHDVGPLVHTKWNQGYPFNCVIPKADGRSVVTGCTATAMAQIMKVHQWPDSGVGSNEYDYDVKDSKKNFIATVHFGADFESRVYDWANMLDVYDSNATTSEKEAVSYLMYDCGVAENSEYGVDETKAGVTQSAIALINNFKYDKSMRRAVRDYYTDDDWNDLVYAELVAGRPMIYSGNAGAESGHSFICDGYRASDGYFSFNWGWGGYCDGYYALTGPGALQPDGSGIGGAGIGKAYIYGQSIIYNIKPDEGGEYAPQVYLRDAFANLKPGAIYTTIAGEPTYNYTVNLESDDDCDLYCGITAWNNGFVDVGLDYGVTLRNVDTGEEYTKMGGSFGQIKVTGVSGNFASFSTSMLPKDGVYEIIPVCRLHEGEPWERIMPALSFEYARLTLIGTEHRPNPDAIQLKNELCFDKFPVVGNGNIVTGNGDFKVAFSELNNSDTNQPDYFVMALKIGRYLYSWDIGDKDKGLAAGVASQFTVNLGSNISLCTPGELYTFDFYRDGTKTTRMNIPSVTFYYAKPGETAITEVTNLIKKAQEGEGNVGIIRNLVKKVLKK